MSTITEQRFQVTKIEHFLLEDSRNKAARITLTPTKRIDTTGLPAKWYDIGLVSEVPIVLVTAYPAIWENFELGHYCYFSDLGRIIQNEKQAQLERIGILPAECTITLSREQVQHLKLELHCCLREEIATPNPRPTYRKGLEELIETVNFQTKDISTGDPVSYNLTITRKDTDSVKADFEVMKAMGQ
jgi:hypothetical protein